MRRLLASAAPLLILLLVTASPAAVVTVDDDGGADYAVIQDAVDSASWGDTVLVHPGTYTAVEDLWCGGYGSPVCVCIRGALTLTSSGGPGVTTIDGEGKVVCGVMAEWGDPVVIEGFTITNGPQSYWGDAAVVLDAGVVRNNILIGFSTGVSTDMMWYWPGSVEPRRTRGAAVVIEGNDIACYSGGLYLRTWSSSRTDVVGNTIHGGHDVGVSVYGVGDILFVDNEVSGNEVGVHIRNPSRTVGVQFSIDMFSNQIIDNTERNLDIRLSDINPGSACDITIGGSMENANDCYGAPTSLKLVTYDYDVFVYATHNYWGSVACTTFVPLFDIAESFPETAFVFEPFIDESHLVTYDCQGVPVRESSWGAIKALYR